jgi:hypothetical protein
MILQVGALVYLIGGIAIATAAVARNKADEVKKQVNSKFSIIDIKIKSLRQHEGN